MSGSLSHPGRHPTGRIRKDTLVVAVLFLAVLACIVVLVVRYEGGKKANLVVVTALQQVQTPDGATLSLENVTFGKSHQLPVTLSSSGSSLFEGSTTRACTANTANDSIVLWFSRREAQTGRALGFNWWSHSVALDEHGCEIEDDEPGMSAFSRNSAMNTSGSRPLQKVRNGEYDMVIAHSAVRPFRHSGPTFKLRLFDTNGNAVAEFNVPDPSPSRGQYPTWTPEPLPATKSVGDLAVTLNKLTAKKVERSSSFGKSESYQLSPAFELTENGEPAENWTRQTIRFFDAAGNSASPLDCRLCPRESAWKMQLRAFRDEHAQFDESEMWTAPSIALPTNGATTRLNVSHAVQGVKIELSAVGDRGTTSHSDLEPARGNSSTGTSGGVGAGEKRWSYSIQTKSQQGSSTTTVTCDLPHIVVKLTGMTDEHFAPDLRAKDDQGRDVKAYSAAKVGGLDLWFLEAAPDAKSLDLTFVVQKGRTFEVFVTPPDVEPLKVAPNSPATLERRAELFAIQIEQLKRALEDNPANASACNFLAWAYATAPPELRDVKQATALAERAVSQEPTNRYFVNTLGVACYRDERFEQAVELLERNSAGKSDSTACFDLYFLAMAYAKTGDPEKATDSFRRAVQVHRASKSTLIPMHVTELNEFRKEAAALLAVGTPEEVFGRADELARLGEWQKAAAEFARAVELFPDDHWQWYRSACLQYQAGDHDAYQRHCGEMLERFGDTGDPFIAERTAKICLLAANAKQLGGRPKDLASRAADQQPNNAWFLLARGLAEYRDENFSEAVNWLQRAERAQSNNVYCDSLILLCLAMSHHRSGEGDDAREKLDSAVRLMDEQLPRLDAGALDTAWHDWLICQIVRREAEALVRGPAKSEEGQGREQP